MLCYYLLYVRQLEHVFTMLYFSPVDYVYIIKKKKNKYILYR